MDGDTIDMAAVPEGERLSGDVGEGSDATGDGLDDDLGDVYADPGVVVEEALG